MGNIGTTSESNPVTTHGIFNMIITNEEQYILLRDKAYAMEKMYRSMASACLIEAIASIYRMMADTYRLLGDFYEEMYQYWLAKGILYDDIEAATSGLFANSAEVRERVRGLMNELIGSFRLDTGYNAATITPAMLQLKYASRGDLDTANGIKWLNEYLIQTGEYTDEKRVELLNNITENDCGWLSALSSIFSSGGYEAGNKALEEMVKLYYEDTDDIRFKEFVWAALEEVGTEEIEGTNNVLYNTWFYDREVSDPQGNAYAWCAVFTMWCADQTGLCDGQVLPIKEKIDNEDWIKFAAVSHIKNEYINKESYYEVGTGYMPYVGDFICFQTRSNSGAIQNHIGIVAGYDAEINRVYTVEGNAGNGVKAYSYDAENSKIVGYCSNGYSEKMIELPEGVSYDDFIDTEGTYGTR